MGEQDREQQLVGHDHERHAEARGDAELAHDLDLDVHDHEEAEGVGQQGDGPGDHQFPERDARRRQGVGAAEQLELPGVGHLRGVAHADGEDQKRHQDGHRVHAVAEQRQQSQQPGHRQERA